MAAFAIGYRAQGGHWPEDLTDALPPIEGEGMIDPRTGEPFLYDVVDGTPRIRSMSTDDLFSRHDV